MSLLDPVLDFFRGKAITIPPLDGAFRPNTKLDDARLLGQFDDPDDIVQTAKGKILVASGKNLFTLSKARRKPALERGFQEAITALAAMPDGSVVIGLDDGKLARLDANGTLYELVTPGLSCPTAMVTLDGTTVIVTQGSSTLRPSEWRRDFLERNSKGALWVVDVSNGGARKLAGGLAFPNGVALNQDGQQIIVSECWQNRLIEIPKNGGSKQTVLADLPGYPSRLHKAHGKGYWLALFAPRNRLIEFVLAEKKFRQVMLSEVAPEHWIVPALCPPRSFLEPLQCGSVRSMGVSKAWAPTRSYGLLVRLDGALKPVSSFHSRANGTRHGVTGVLDMGHQLLVVAKGANAVIALENMKP